MMVTDYLDCSEGRPKRISGRTDLVRVIEGTGRAGIEFAPRLDFGRFPTQIDVRVGEMIDWLVEELGGEPDWDVGLPTESRAQRSRYLRR